VDGRPRAPARRRLHRQAVHRRVHRRRSRPRVDDPLAADRPGRRNQADGRAMSARTWMVAAALALASAYGCGGSASRGSAGSGRASTASGSRSTRYDDLRALFTEWRAFQKPKLADGVPDYSAAAMAAQQRELPSYQRRLQAIDPAAWPVNQQVDWQIVR